EEFYQRKFDWIPDNIRKEIGHFNVFPLDPFVGNKARPIPYKRRDYYKIMLVRGGSKVHYADKVVEVKKQALSFSNPMIPYKWEHLEEVSGGFFCVFNQHFFHQFGDLNQYSVFQPDGNLIFELTDAQVEEVTRLFERMLAEINSEYPHKYDLLRTLVFELIHFALKLQPVPKQDRRAKDAAQRISTLFMELLERQFPIDDNHQQVGLRSASDFARQLNIHVNHLNRAVKETSEKTTSQIIASRLMQEAKILLKHSTWPVSDIAYALGFAEPTHFNNFFKKHQHLSPLKFRNG
ncbi:MAG: helix-turn-helix transcriptional regulator, partial [Bacteroidota bacterium]|nr:helix-turn-helix transcriptional regulator [Bacteroidota bacterium]